MAQWQPVLHAWEAWVFCIILAGLVPFHGMLAYGRLKLAPEPIPTRTKLRLYATVLVMEWTLVLVAVVIARRHGIGLPGLGQTLANLPLTLSVTGAGILALVALAMFNAGQIRRAKREELAASVERARKFVPVGSTQVAAFVLVALTAGICEEILYRGWLLSFLGALTGSMWIGMILSAVLFGIGHAYQGRQGIVATGVLGLVFGTMFVLVRSLVPGQVIHAGIDLVNGILAGKIVKGLKAEPAPVTASAEQRGANEEPPTSA